MATFEVGDRARMIWCRPSEPGIRRFCNESDLHHPGTITDVDDGRTYGTPHYLLRWDDPRPLMAIGRWCDADELEHIDAKHRQ